MKNASKWIVRPQARREAELQLICFPQAAGNAWSFFRLAERLPAAIELLAIQYPGHGDRLGEEPIRDFDTLVNHIAHVLVPEIRGAHALFGHSMGAILAFETARALRAVGCPPSDHVFVSGYNAPGGRSEADGLPPLYELTDSQLLERIEALECTPREVLEDREMQSLLFRMIRADSAVCDSHVLRDRTPIVSPITALGGVDDPRTSEAGLDGWREFTAGQFSVQWYPGNHGFLLAQEELFQERLVSVLLHGGGTVRS